MPVSSIAPHSAERKATTDQLLKVREAFIDLVDVPGFLVCIRTDDGIEILGEGHSRTGCPADLSALVWSQQFDGGISVALLDSDPHLIPEAASRELAMALVEAVVKTALSVAEVEKREESLLEELSASWESLEALYEISTDVLRSMNINETLKRLIDRLVSMHRGLHATLFVSRHGQFEALVGTERHIGIIAPSELGPVAKVIEHGQTVTLDYVPSIPLSQVCWNKASALAAAPITAPTGTIGFLVLWNEDRVFSFDSAFVRLLEAIAYQASILMERDRLNRQVRESDLLAKELEIASFIQQTLLLANSPENVPGMEIAACSLPSQHIDGDFYDFFQHPDGTLDVMVGDVMGKGVAAALLGAAAKNQILRSLANLALRSKFGAPQPVEIVRRAASRMSEQLISLERFVTMCYARFDMKARSLHLVDCGHTPAILSRTGQACAFLRSEDLPLGVLEPYVCEQLSFTIRRGDTYFFYSDGVTENRSVEGEFFGAERLAECIENWSSLGPELLVGQVRKEAEKFRHPETFSDDFTCVAVRISCRSAQQQPVVSTGASFLADLQELPGFRAWLYPVAGEDTCLTPEAASRMELACTELFVNFAMHNQQLRSSELIRIERLTYSDHVTVRMMHRGPAFDPLSVPPPTFDGSKDNGFGTYIVLRSADEVKYERDRHGTNVISVSFLGSEA